MDKCTYCGDEYGTNPGTWCPECQGWQKCWDKVSALVDATATLYSAEMVWRNSSLGANGKRLSIAMDNFFNVAAAYLAAREPKNAETD